MADSLVETPTASSAHLMNLNVINTMSTGAGDPGSSASSSSSSSSSSASSSSVATSSGSNVSANVSGTVEPTTGAGNGSSGRSPTVLISVSATTSSQTTRQSSLASDLLLNEMINIAHHRASIANNNGTGQQQPSSSTTPTAPSSSSNVSSTGAPAVSSQLSSVPSTGEQTPTLITLSASPSSSSSSSNVQQQPLELLHRETPKQAPANRNVGTSIHGRSADERDDCGEPEAKRKKVDKPSAKVEKLELRLGGILCCAVCLDLPRTAMYQCSMGHLMCAGCFTHLLADGRLRDQNATCPNCRTEISKNNSSRNLAVEKAVSELPAECQYCSKEFPNKSIDYHESAECEDRPTDCKFARIGCQWRGPIHEVSTHEGNCAHPRKSGADVMVALQAHDVKAAEDKKLFLTLIDLLSYEKIIFNDLQLKPYRTDEYVHRLYYETSRFSAFNHQWVVKAIINKSQRDPHESCERDITYQLILKSKTTSPLPMHFFVLRGPFSDIKVDTQIYKHDFADTETESPFKLLPLPDTAECNRLLAAKAINFRLIMFLASK
ncbi:zinc finger TRAF-type-containing protein 1 homolog [Anopheles marshallii]|uniref:zinc finger TRAF-type-containing protein 1 homolog n=1 Tax=Anopheles marshallii TaxID=1521116 RepID=UPI00237A1672|nr:zinc finger TRAF-type-containing protein 1 homolog [Anopheles marshallii]